MGKILNTGNAEFAAVRKEEYVDKSMLIAYVNSVLGSLNKYMCVSRARRFGKSIAAKMLCAYYDESADSRALFADLKIAHDPSYEEHRNKYPVIYIDVASFMTKRSLQGENIVDAMSNELKDELVAAYPEVELEKSKDLSDLLWRVWNSTGKQFIMTLAYVAARKDFVMVRELPTGKGFADIVLIPRRNVNQPAIVLELKYNHSAESGLAQIKRQQYADSLCDYVGEVVLVGICYDEKTKKHNCVIERMTEKKTTRITTRINRSKTTRKTSAIILEEIRKNAHITREELAVICGITIDGIKWQLKKMQDKKILYRDGTNGGKWVILNNEH